MAETLTAHHCSMHHIRELHVSSQQKAASNFPCLPEEGVEGSPITGFGKANPIGRTCAHWNDRWQGCGMRFTLQVRLIIRSSQIFVLLTGNRVGARGTGRSKDSRFRASLAFKRVHLTNGRTNKRVHSANQSSYNHQTHALLKETEAKK
jgi:hypothetical protein